jgi:uncharacterized damage-inducible protein DinB
MNADAFRHFYAYHFAQNRTIWDAYITPLSQEQFTRGVTYSHGSVRDQVLHLIEADAVWFSQLRGAPILKPLGPFDVDDRAAIRARWDAVEQRMREYLATLQDEMLCTKPFPDHPEDKDLILWQVLVHVVNHGTDHRAQILRVLNDLGVATTSQDYVFYAYDHPLP